MEELQSRHRKEQRDLQSQVTQKKKQASKKTRKAANEECERLERELKERQEYEIREFNGEVFGDNEGEGVSGELEELTLKVDGEEVAQEKTNGAEETPSSSQQDNTEQPPNGGPNKKRNRQKDRLARRAAEQEALAQQASLEAQSLPDLKSLERTRMLASMSAHHLSEIEIRADGHCLYSAVVDQLKYLCIPISTTTSTSEKLEPSYKTVRAAAAEYISSHAEDFEPFLEEPLETYVHKIRDTAEWGGHLELLALAKTYGVEICVLQDYGRVERIEGGGGGGGGNGGGGQGRNGESGKEGDGEGKKEIWLGYYKHGFGLGEHYNSLRKKKDGKKEGG